MMPSPSKYTPPDQTVLKLAVQTKLSVQAIEEGVRDVIEGCKVLAQNGALGTTRINDSNINVKTPQDQAEFAEVLKEDKNDVISDSLNKHCDDLLVEITARQQQHVTPTAATTTTTVPALEFIVDPRPLASPSAADLHGLSYLAETCAPVEDALMRFSSITSDNNEDINALSDLNKTSQDASSSSSLFFNAPNVTFLFDLTASSLPAIVDLASSTYNSSSSNAHTGFVPFVPGHSIDSSGTATPNMPVSATQTPITSALEQMDWVVVLSTSQPKPSQNLMSYFGGVAECPIFKSTNSIIDSLLNKISTNASADPSVLSLPLSQDDLATLSATSSSSSNTPVSSPAASSSSTNKNNGCIVHKYGIYLTSRGVLKHPPNGTFPDKLRRSTLDVYYKTLENVLNWETSRLQVRERIRLILTSPERKQYLTPSPPPSVKQTHNHDALLRNKDFHRSLFACCAEVVLCSNSCLDLKFPHVLNFCGIDAFTFLKTVETFVRHASLPPALKKHLKDVEDSIISKHAWAENCDLYSLLLQHQAHPSWPPKILRTEGDEFNTTDRILPKPTPKDRPPAEQAVTLFLKKFMATALRKIKSICR